MKETEMRQVGRWIAEALLQRTMRRCWRKSEKRCSSLCEAFPLYAERRAKAQAEVRA